MSVGGFGCIPKVDVVPDPSYNPVAAWNFCSTAMRNFIRLIFHDRHVLGFMRPGMLSLWGLQERYW